jgi:hypothetical protein
MNDVANGKAGFSVAANQRLPRVGSDRTVVTGATANVREPDAVSVPSE